MATRIPVYRRELAPGIGFTTFSSEGTELLGWIVSDDPAHEHLDALRIPSRDHEYLTELFPEVALAHARAGLGGLRFDDAVTKCAPDYLQLATQIVSRAFLDDCADPPGSLAGGVEIGFHPHLNFHNNDVGVSVNGKLVGVITDGEIVPGSSEKTWRDRAIEKPLL